MTDNTPNPPTDNHIDADPDRRIINHALNISSRVKPIDSKWIYHIFQGDRILHFNIENTQEDAVKVIADWTKTNASKLYLIECGILKRRAIRQTRKRDYDRTAECWKRHEAKEHARQVASLERSVQMLYTQQRQQDAYDAMSLDDRTRYEKLLASPRPLTADDWQFAMNFLAAWAEKAAQS